MKKIGTLFIALLVCIGNCYAIENLFYILRSNSPARITSIQNATASLKQHTNDVNILVSQAYQIDEHGMVWGFIDPDVMAISKKHSIKLMALITNVDFDQKRAHQFFESAEAQTRAIQSILEACRKNHFYGVQFDFEMIPIKDKEALTHFYQQATEALHKHGFIVSYAVAPVVADSLQSSFFLKKLYERWEGAYDLSVLGKIGDFVTVMTYNQHGEGTTPGPTATVPWVEAVIQYTLQYVPAEKISLGIPAYSTYWYTGPGSGSSSNKVSSHMTDIDYQKVLFLLQKYKAHTQWNDKDKVNYAIYDHDWLNEYLFIEDVKSFAAKLALVKKYHLRGISVFDIGTEDPKIWEVLKIKDK